MKFVEGNLFDSNAEALVNTVNTVGVMGKGVALQFKERFPVNFKLYEAACKRGEVQIGKMFITSTDSMLNPKWIINFPTKKHWIHPSKYEYIEFGIDDLIQQIEKLNIQSIAIPPLGAGQGGLDWEIVKEMIQRKLGHLNMDIIIYQPSDSIYAHTQNNLAKLTRPRAMILSLIAQYKKLGYDITLLEIQKLAYFLQRMGQYSLKLNYQKYVYGPYAHNLQHLLHELENGYLIIDKSIMDAKPLDSVILNHENRTVIEKYVEDECTNEEKDRLKNVFLLMSGYESPFGLELLSTVDWILNSNNNIDLSEAEIKHKIKQWSQRKDDSFNLEHVRSAQKRLLDFKQELSYC